MPYPVLLQPYFCYDCFKEVVYPHETRSYLRANIRSDGTVESGKAPTSLGLMKVTRTGTICPECRTKNIVSLWDKETEDARMRELEKHYLGELKTIMGK